MTSAEKQKAYRERKKKVDMQFNEREAERKRADRLRKKGTETKEEANRAREQARERQRRRRLRLQADQKSPSPSHRSGFKSKQSLGKALKRAMKALPSSPSKKGDVVRRLAVKLDFVKDKKRRRNSGISEEIRSSVLGFFCRDDISRQAPGIKDAVTIREGGLKTRVQKRHMSMSLLEAYQLFKQDNPEATVGKSKFAELRPPYVLPRADTPRNVCLCKYHENTKLLLDSLYKHLPRQAFKSVDNYVDAVVCSRHSPECMLNDCDECCDGKKFLQITDNMDEEDKEMGTSWHVWESNEKGVQEKKQKLGELGEVLHQLQNTAMKFTRHVFIKHQQSACFQAKRKVGSETCAVLQVDFAENYTAGYQDEIQSAYWSQSQITVFTAVVWISDRTKSYVVVSDELQHGKKAVSTFLSALVNDIVKTNPAFRELHVFSDGAASQFKNKYNWFFLSTTLKQMIPEVSIAWHFFATSHGKGAVDGVGGTVKRAVSTAVLSRQVVQVDARSFAETARRVCPKVEVLFISTEDISQFCADNEMEKYWDQAAPLPGTRNVHYISPTSWGQVEYRAYSSAADSSVHTLVQCPDLESSDEESEPQANPCEPPVQPCDPAVIKTGDCLLVTFKVRRTSRLYVGLVADQDSEGLEVRFLRKSDNQGCVFILPGIEDKSWITRQQVVRHLNPDLDHRGRYHFPDPVQAE